LLSELVQVLAVALVLEPVLARASRRVPVPVRVLQPVAVCW
jgi:hypothetical protein